jgi:hypothetical protein
MLKYGAVWLQIRTDGFLLIDDVRWLSICR